MYIVTTSKRLRFITAAIIALLVLTGIVSFQDYYQKNVNAPKQLLTQFRQTVLYSDILSVDHLDLTSLRMEEISRIEVALIEELGSSNLPDVAMATVSLMPQTIGYLGDDEKVLLWFNDRITTKDIDPGSQWIELGSHQNVKKYQLENHCLEIQKIDKAWKISSHRFCTL